MSPYTEVESSRGVDPRPVFDNDLAVSLTEEQKRLLGALYAAPEGVAELTIATLDLGTRLGFQSLGLVDFVEQDGEGESLRITDTGWKLIADFAAAAPEHVEAQESLERARHELLGG